MPMRNRRRLVIMLLLITVILPPVVLADDIKDAETILCTSVQATVCFFEGDCEIGVPWNWNIPQFIEIDFAEKMPRTTLASQENRQTPFKYIEREAEVIYLQGVEDGRAFSITIREDTGQLSAAVARDGVTVSVFGACTPLLARD
jgi:hypothetical protein